MAKLDVYIKNLVNHGAAGLTLAANQMVTLRMDGGPPRAMKKMCTQDEILALVGEVVAPPDMAEFQRGGTLVAVYDAPGFGPVTIKLSRAPDGAVCDITRGAPAGTPASGTPSVSPSAVAPTSRAAMPDPAPPTRRAAPAPGAEPRLNAYLRLAAQRKASDLHLRSDEPPVLRVSGSCTPLSAESVPGTALSEFVAELLDPHQREVLERDGQVVFGHAVPNGGRFRVSLLQDRRGVAMVARCIPEKVPTLDSIDAPSVLRTLASLTRGLVLLAGPPGSGRSTTLAALVDEVNNTREVHVLCLEQPVEHVHASRRSVVTQRELGTHCADLRAAFGAARTGDVDVLVVTDLSDAVSMRMAMDAADAGQLVLAVVAGNTAAGAVERVLEAFPSTQQAQVRGMLAGCLRGVVAQALCARAGGGRVAAFEVLVGTTGVANLIRDGKTYQLDSAMAAGGKDGMMTLQDGLAALVQKKLVDPREAFIRAPNRQAMKAVLAPLGWKPTGELELGA